MSGQVAEANARRRIHRAQHRHSLSAPLDNPGEALGALGSTVEGAACATEEVRELVRRGTRRRYQSLLLPRVHVLYQRGRHLLRLVALSGIGRHIGRQTGLRARRGQAGGGATQRIEGRTHRVNDGRGTLYGTTQ